MIKWSAGAGSTGPDHPEYVYVSREGAEDGSHLSQEEWSDLRACLGLDGGVSLRNRISLAVTTALQWGQVDGEHHLRWVIDTMLRDLLSEEEYQTLVTEKEWWDEGIAP